MPENIILAAKLPLTSTKGNPLKLQGVYYPLETGSMHTNGWLKKHKSFAIWWHQVKKIFFEIKYKFCHLFLCKLAAEKEKIKFVFIYLRFFADLSWLNKDHCWNFVLLQAKLRMSILFFFLLSAFLRNCFLCWDRWNGDVTPTLDAALLCCSRAGSDLGLHMFCR